MKKENVTPESSKEPFAVVPSRVTAHKGITPSTKLALTYLFERYRAKTEDGKPWTFSNASIAKGTGLPVRTVRNVTKDLQRHGVLKLYGTIRPRTRPMPVFVFIEANVDRYLTAKRAVNVEVLETENGRPVVATFKKTDKEKDAAGDAAGDAATIALYKQDEVLKEDSLKVRTLHSIPEGREGKVKLNSENTDRVGLVSFGGSSSTAEGVPAGPVECKQVPVPVRVDPPKVETPDCPKGTPVPTDADSREPQTSDLFTLPYEFIPNIETTFHFGKDVPPDHCWKRTVSVAKGLNERYGFNFVVEDGARGTELFGHKVMAYDAEEKVALIMADDHGYPMKPHVQSLFSAFEKHGWHVFVYLAPNQIANCFIRNPEFKADPKKQQEDSKPSDAAE